MNERLIVKSFGPSVIAGGVCDGASSELMDLQLQFLTDKSHPLYFDDGKVFQ